MKLCFHRASKQAVQLAAQISRMAQKIIPPEAVYAVRSPEQLLVEQAVFTPGVWFQLHSNPARQHWVLCPGQRCACLQGHVSSTHELAQNKFCLMHRMPALKRNCAEWRHQARVGERTIALREYNSQCTKSICAFNIFVALYANNGGKLMKTGSINKMLREKSNMCVYVCILPACILYPCAASLSDYR